MAEDTHRTKAPRLGASLLRHCPLLNTSWELPSSKDCSSHELTSEPIACAKSAQCAPLKHHFDECAERVQEQHENPDYKGPKEDCVEECEYIYFVYESGNWGLEEKLRTTMPGGIPTTHLHKVGRECHVSCLTNWDLRPTHPASTRFMDRS